MEIKFEHHPFETSSRKKANKGYLGPGLPIIPSSHNHMRREIPAKFVSPDHPLDVFFEGGMKNLFF
jgi:hypothetical protein